MNIEEQIIEIITREKTILYSQKKAEKELLILLQKLTDENKKSLKPKILKLLRKYNREAFNVKGSEDKYRLACTAGFVMLNYSEYKSHWGVDYDDILDWYCPTWFSEYYNNDQWMSVGYDKLLAYIDKGYITPSGGKIAQELVALKNQYKNFNNITLTEHIWTLFQYESEVHLTQRYTKFDRIEWKSKLLKLEKDNRVDRDKLLNECLNTSTRNFNKVAVGFFFDLFSELEPSDKELLNLQETLFLVLQTQHSKPINQTLKYLKRIHKEPSFNIAGFMEQIPVLLSWSVKAVVNGTLSLIDALIKTYPANKEELGLLVVQTLGQEDESLQSKAVKLLAKHKLLETQSILEEINIYADGLYHSTKSLLPKLNEAKSTQEQIEITPPQYIREDNKIVYPESFDEMVFFFSQVFEGNNVYDFDLFVDLLPKIDRMLDAKNVNKLSVAFNRAYTIYTKWNSSENVEYSKINLIMISCFIHYAELLIERYPNTSDDIIKSKKIMLRFFETLKKEREEEYQRILDGKVYMINKNNHARERHLRLLETEPCHGHTCLIDFDDISFSNSIFYIYSMRAKHALDCIASKTKKIPILSTPTHTPSWISIESLIEKLKVNTDIEKLNTFDFQIALNRVVVEKIEAKQINKQLTGEIKEIFSYLFLDTKLNIKAIKHPEYWQTVIIRKRHIDDAHLFTRVFYPNKPKYNILAPTTWQLITKVSFYTQFNEFGHFSHYKKDLIQNTLVFHYNRTLYKSTFDSIFKHKRLDDSSLTDISLSLLLFPTMPQYIFEEIKYAKNGYNTEPDVIKYNINILQILMDIWIANTSAMNYLFVSDLLINENKSVRTLASELWIKATSEGTMNHQLLGETLGKLEHNEYAPLKRFTDLIVANMLNISSLHNEGLHTLLSAMIVNMNDEPIKGTKKLLEIYLEVLSLTKLDVPSEALDKFGIWGEVKSLKSVINKIVKD